MAEELLTIPEKAGELILSEGGVVARPLLSTDKFIKFCNERDLKIDRNRLYRLERLKMFAPIFRVKMPNEETKRMALPIAKDDKWFKRGWAWDTSGMDFDYEVPEAKDRESEAYYSAFQIDQLELILSQMTMSLQIDGFLDRSEDDGPIDWASNGEKWIEFGKTMLESKQVHRFRPAIALLCQFISDRYYPHVRTEMRTIKVPLGPRMSFDEWTETHLPDWDWYDLARAWDAEKVAEIFDLTPGKLKHAFEALSVTQEFCDPLARWYPLVQFVSVAERDKLKGKALRAETLRYGAYMLRLLYRDLYEDDLPHPNEVTGQIITHFPELEVRKETRRHLEFVVNRFELNPRPKLSLLVEGPSEETAIRLIFDKYFGADPGKYGIEIVSLGSVDNATGGKHDKFRAILRLIDYLHHYQTISFLILDNENYARRLKKEAQKAKSIHHDKRFITRPEYIRIWKQAFELDNFSATEIADAFNELCEGRVHFTQKEVAACKSKPNPNPGAALSKLYENKAQYGLEKLKLAEILVEKMLSPETRRKSESRPIIKILERAATLAQRNPFPTRQELWEINQESKYLGKKRS